MLDRGEQLIGCVGQGIRLGLQVPTTALLDIGCSLGQLGKEGILCRLLLSSVLDVNLRSTGQARTSANSQPWHGV